MTSSRICCMNCICSKLSWGLKCFVTSTTVCPPSPETSMFALFDTETCGQSHRKTADLSCQDCGKWVFALFWVLPCVYLISFELPWVTYCHTVCLSRILYQGCVAAVNVDRSQYFENFSLVMTLSILFLKAWGISANDGETTHAPGWAGITADRRGIQSVEKRRYQLLCGSSLFKSRPKRSIIIQGAVWRFMRKEPADMPLAKQSCHANLGLLRCRNRLSPSTLSQ